MSVLVIPSSKLRTPIKLFMCSVKENNLSKSISRKFLVLLTFTVNS